MLVSLFGDMLMFVVLLLFLLLLLLVVEVGYCDGGVLPVLAMLLKMLRSAENGLFIFLFFLIVWIGFYKDKIVIIASNVNYYDNSNYYKWKYDHVLAIFNFFL